MKPINRREFLALAGVAATANLISPQRLALAQASFPEPPLLPLRRPEAGLLETDLTALPSRLTVLGRPTRLLTYNSRLPGPVLRVREGDRVRLRFINKLEEMTNLHLHGLHVSPNVDNPVAEVAPGEVSTLEFDIPKGSAGTYWYHPHMHGTVARQMFAGLAGAIVVEGPLEAMPELRGVEEHLIVLRDLELVGDQPAPHAMMDWMNGKEGSLLLVNGASKPTLNATRPTLRLRLLNASNARYYRLQLENHPLYLIATDGGFIGQPVALEELLLAPGERAEVLVRLEREGRFRLLNLPYDRGTMMHGMGGMGRMGGMGNMGGGMKGNAPTDQMQALMTVVAPRNPRPLPLPSSLDSVPTLDVTKASVTRRVVMTEQMMQARFFLNGKSFDPKRVDFTGRLGDLEIWELENRADMDHPFHLHTYPFQVISRNGRPEPFRAWKDTVNLRKNDVVRIAVPLTDFTGITVYHCHVLEHEDRGMMGVLEVKDPRN